MFKRVVFDFQGIINALLAHISSRGVFDKDAVLVVGVEGCDYSIVG